MPNPESGSFKPRGNIDPSTEQANLEAENRRAEELIVFKNIRTQLDRKQITREQANALAENAGITVHGKDASYEVWDSQWNEEGAITEELLLHVLNTEAQKRTESSEGI